MVPSKDESYRPLTGKSSSAAPSAPPSPFFHSFAMSRSANSNRNTREQGGAGGILSTHLDSVESVIDSGFPVVQEFERGIVDFVQGSQSTVDLSELQEPITTTGKFITFTKIYI